MNGRRTAQSAPLAGGRRRVVLFLAMVFATACAGQAPPSGAPAAKDSAPAAKGGAPEELVVVNFGGTFAQYWKEIIIEPFEKEHNAKVTEVTSLTMDTVAKMRAAKDNPQIDVVMTADIGSVTAANEGLLEPLDENRIPNMKQVNEKARVKDDPYVQYVFVSTILAYNTDKIKTPPTSWEDLWNPDYKGHVALSDTNACCGIPFIVSIAKMNGGGLDNMEPGFQRIATLKPNVLTFYTSHDQMASLLNQGEAWIGPWVTDRAATQRAANAPIEVAFPKEGGILFGVGIGMSKGTKHKDLAEKYINFVLDAKQQKPFSEKAWFAPANKNVTLSPEVAKYVPYGDERLSNLQTLDWDAVSKGTPAWTERWQREITSR
jgi:putative spermidine/putrescine transport system substrate-binding protein